MKTTALATIILSCTLPASALSNSDITGAVHSTSTSKSDNREQISLSFTLTGPEGSGLRIAESQKIKAKFTTADGGTTTQTGELNAFFCNSYMGRDNVLIASIDFPAINDTQSITLDDSIKIQAAAAMATSPSQTVDAAKGGSFQAGGITFTIKQQEGFNKKKGISLEYPTAGSEHMNDFQFFDAKGKSMKPTMFNSAGGGSIAMNSYYFANEQMPSKIGITYYKDIQELSVPLKLNFKLGEAGSSMVFNADAAMPESAPIKPMDMSDMTPAQQKMLYTMAAYTLMGEAKLMESGKKDDLAAMMSTMATAMTKAQSPDLPQDYQDFLKDGAKLFTDVAQQLKKDNTPEAAMAAMFALMPKIEEINTKYPDVVEFMDKASLSMNNASADPAKDACIAFGIQKQMAAYTKKLKAEGVTDEQELQIKITRAAASFLMKKAKAIK